MHKFPKPWYRPSRAEFGTRRSTASSTTLAPIGTPRSKSMGKLLANPPKVEPKEEDRVPSDLLVGLIQRFMADMRANGAPDTIEWYRHRLQRLVDYLSAHNLESIRVDELKRSHVTEWMNAYPALSSGSRRNLGRAIQRVMNWAVEQEDIDHNPLAGMRKPKAGKRERVISDADGNTSCRWRLTTNFVTCWRLPGDRMPPAGVADR